MMANYPDEFVCDMAQTYGIFDIKRVPARLLATLAVGLGDDSRVKRKATGTTVSDEKILLALIADCVKWLCWSMTEDGKRGINRPESILDYYLERQKPESEYELFDSPEAFWARINEITQQHEVEE